jgi:hypothetical protein
MKPYFFYNKKLKNLIIRNTMNFIKIKYMIMIWLCRNKKTKKNIIKLVNLITVLNK